MIVKNGLVAFPGEDEFLQKDLRLENGKIAEIGRDLTGPDILDASGMHVLPGGIDPHVHFYDPGYTEKEDFFHGTAAAASGGITTIVDMPCTSVPPVTDAASLKNKLEIVQPKAHIDFAFFGGVSRQLFDSGYEDAMASISRDVMGYKVYSVSGMEEVWGALDHFRFCRVLETARDLGVIILLHAEDAEYVDNASEFYKKEGSTARQWHDARPELAEVLAVSGAARILQETGGNLHIVHVGSAEAAGIIASFSSREQEAVLTGETCPQYLAFNLDDFLAQGAALKISPPIKPDGNQRQLHAFLKNGALSFVTSDHAPGTKEEKAPGDIWCNSAGIAGTGTILPYLYSDLLTSGELRLSRFLEIISEGAARRYRFFDRKGSIETGKDADLVLINPNSDWTVRGEEFLSKGKITPFEGTVFRGRVEKTLVRGRVVYDRSKNSALHQGWGSFIRPRLS